MVELRVADEGREVLVYSFGKISEAVDMMSFLADFLPQACFLIQPVRH